MQLDFYFAIDSRYSYLAAMQVPEIEKEFGCTIGWKPLSFQALMDARGDDPYDGRKLIGQYDPAYRDKDGTVTLRSAKCTHLGCVVAWNTAESTWDCPCHGSRFTVTGEVMSGPAEAPLPPVE